VAVADSAVAAARAQTQTLQSAIVAADDRLAAAQTKIAEQAAALTAAAAHAAAQAADLGAAKEDARLARELADRRAAELDAAREEAKRAYDLHASAGRELAEARGAADQLQSTAITAQVVRVRACVCVFVCFVHAKFADWWGFFLCVCFFLGFLGVFFACTTIVPGAAPWARGRAAGSSVDDAARRAYGQVGRVFRPAPVDVGARTQPHISVFLSFADLFFIPEGV
jgi:hypothetical protein